MDTKNKKLRIAVLVGGPSAEYDISLKSGENVLNSIDQNKYDAKLLIIDKNGNWPISIDEFKQNFDLAFIAMHGAYGEDGTIQSILEKEKIPFTGSTSLTHALGINKFLTLMHLKLFGLVIPFSLLISKNEWSDSPRLILKSIDHFIGYPLVVKPNFNGSSIAVSLVRRQENLTSALNEVFNLEKTVLIQPFIDGREFTCSVLDFGFSESAFALSPTEIIPKDRQIFDYESKYDPNLALEITPARIPEFLANQIKRTAILAHQAIGCIGMSRTDMILSKDSKLYVLEINTIPGLTENSLIVKAAQFAGMNMTKLVDHLINSALNYWQKKFYEKHNKE
ncbi:MAG: D-alanine--D-alanine ligase family protein [Minisyncoccia bacterium]